MADDAVLVLVGGALNIDGCGGPLVTTKPEERCCCCEVDLAFDLANTHVSFSADGLVCGPPPKSGSISGEGRLGNGIFVTKCCGPAGGASGLDTGGPTVCDLAYISVECCIPRPGEGSCRRCTRVTVAMPDYGGTHEEIDPVSGVTITTIGFYATQCFDKKTLKATDAGHLSGTVTLTKNGKSVTVTFSD